MAIHVVLPQHQKQDEAYSKALKCDRTSAFGGIVAFNKMVNIETAKKINKIFTEVVIAPKFSPKSKKFSSKRNLILIEFNNTNEQNKISFKNNKNFLLMQEKDNKNIKIKELSVKSKIKPNDKLVDDMIFAFTFVNILIQMQLYCFRFYQQSVLVLVRQVDLMLRKNSN